MSDVDVENYHGRSFSADNDNHKQTANIQSLTPVPTLLSALLANSYSADCHPHSPSRLLHRAANGVIALPALPLLLTDAVEMSSPHAVPTTPRVISPSPTPSDASEQRDGYLAPVTRSAARRQRFNTDTQAIPEEDQNNDSEHQSRSGPRNPSSRSGAAGTARRRGSTRKTPQSASSPVVKSQPLVGANGKPSSNGYLSPYANLQDRWRDLSRSPSPLGLIPLHENYRTFIHKHEIPRKLLHVSIGFVTLEFYRRGVQTFEITPWLLSALIPIAATDILRHRYDSVNQLYIRSLGALMRESEVKGYNGVIWYLLGAYIVLRAFPKDVGVMGVLLLSWCDTAASTFGRLYGKHTIKLRHGKSLAGTAAAFLTGVVTALFFWGAFVPSIGTFPNDPEDAFMFSGRLNYFPESIRNLVGWTSSGYQSSVITGPLALGVVSVVSGIVAAGSEFIDLFGWDDNLTIPVLSGLGFWGFLKLFG
ncbi:phosphatidate cytidylyltransferase, putative [Talaromyces stipitatus ATCC 10500]|uniref:Phosphatidate cytidylyltransferase, putative n=1 Tax=Talaromyces stipitatus (strain ATCC 10500 / CBS 375.48 / QM 6759 / NRRL 1006) TaxID=441959 RepID=B8M6K6_TALSN|nr:phosphatidate cytidylyltransferase, putative [Talaromyces stipitatus ATCC 10500]EED19468.1 phosphatidate cytidylyltransferase, putative [Talaromyces stipitatus ATCC 10500]